LETAQAIAAALDLQPVPMGQLKEIHFGELEGVTLQEMERRFPVLHTRWQDKTDMEFQWPGGERRADFFSRAAEACNRIVARHPHENVVVVAHGGTIRACLAHLVPDQVKKWWTYSLYNTGLTHVSARGAVTHLVKLNDVSHLRDMD
jgi:broad specificity phosphatase PhoE